MINKNFWISLLVLFLIYFYVPALSSLISLIGSIIFICQLSAIIKNIILHSSYSPKLFIPPTNRLVLVTGCDSGFGLALARRLDYYGFHVLAGVLSKESDGAKYFETYGSKRLRTIKLDITKQEDINEAVELVAYLTNYKPILDKINEKQSKLNVFDRKFQNQFYGNEDGDLKLWAIVNNAGIAQYTPFEFGDIEKDILPMFEVNVFGLMRITKSFLPFLRQSQGRIVNVGSVAGIVTIGGLTGYACCKHAVRSFTDGLRQELHKFKIKSILIQPTMYKTPISNIDQLVRQFNSTYERTDPEILSDYGGEKYKERFTKHLQKMIVLTRTNIDEVVSSMEDAVTNLEPKIQYLCASDLQKILFWILEQLNLEITDRIFTFRPPKFIVNFMQKINS